jgi:hypothetical protein
MASSPTSSVASSQNPFADSSSPALTVTAIQHVNIRSHAPIQLDYGDTTFTAWSAFFDATFHKFGIINHVDGTVDARTMWHNTEWLQIDQCIASWLYTSVTPALMQMVSAGADCVHHLVLDPRPLPRQRRSTRHLCSPRVPQLVPEG